MSKPTIEQMVAEIHATVVEGALASDELRLAAQAVVDCMWGPKRGEWDDLKEAVLELAGVLDYKPSLTANSRD